MFGTSGIRGEFGTTVTCDLGLSVGRAVASAGYDRVVVGRDARESGEPLQQAVVAGLREAGASVVDVGLAATPTVARAIARNDAAAGAVVTASHNPPQDNGIKLWNPSGQAFDAAQREEIARRVREEDVDLTGWDGVGGQEQDDGATAAHEAALRAAVDLDDTDLSVVVDVGNGVGGLTASVLHDLGCDVQTLNGQPDGRFPGRPSEPTAEHCESLQRLVAETADLGIAHDGDADRMMAVTEDGEFVAGDVLMALFAREAAGEGDRVAAPLNTSLAVDDVLERQGASVEHTKVGDVFVAEAATDPDVVFGGEPSGAWIWPAETLCPDGPLAACKLVELVAGADSLGALADSVETYPIRRDSVETKAKGAVMREVETALREEYESVNDLDGIRVDTEAGWFLVRPSGTQPLVRITAEARGDARADELFEHAHRLVTSATSAKSRSD
ncbi:phosphoglucosamine mutase [Haloarchaeobius amylolyticus]|uniref:phosphoglucosamine mutase n=1 Tax=Haloarchaeobius amylolyticus TaxID=1198296 RepID=UPI00226E2EF7|nr:phosphoglucosamine mutase [Haloarchaeobius amylolyticus]